MVLPTQPIKIGRYIYMVCTTKKKRKAKLEVQSLCIDQTTLCSHIPQMQCASWCVSTLWIDTKTVFARGFWFYPANTLPRPLPHLNQTSPPYKSNFRPHLTKMCPHLSKCEDCSLHRHPSSCFQTCGTPTSQSIVRPVPFESVMIRENVGKYYHLFINLAKKP